MRYALLLTVVLAGCHDDDDRGFEAEADVSLLPAAVAGEDFEALVSSEGRLDGSKSRDPSGAPLSHVWEQTAGTPVSLSDPSSPSPTFTAPSEPGTLTFRLTVTGPNGSDQDSVDVVVKRLLVTAPDAWFVGYGVSGEIRASALGGEGAVRFEWSGLQPWLVVSGAESAALSFTTPTLPDLLNLPDRAEAMNLKRAAQGRLQLRVRATDAAGNTDDDLVNFSAGPFPGTNSGENVALGEPLFLNGGPAESWTWVGTRPDGGTISFFRPDKAPLGSDAGRRVVFFVPDRPGEYEIIVNGSRVLRIHAGAWVGVGARTAPADPFRGECAACHAGQIPTLADLHTPWLGTAHAVAFQEFRREEGSWRDAFRSGLTIEARTVGFSRISTQSNAGFAQEAEAEGYVFAGTSWEEVRRKFPKTANQADVQCEGCHGPGSGHAGDTRGIRTSFDAELCARCHSGFHDQWEASAHADPVVAAPSGIAACNGCHTAQGFAVEMKAQVGADPHIALFAFANPDRPVLPPEDRRDVTCQACHDPHRKTGPHAQLRAFGRVQFRNGAVVEAGNSAVCFLCHQSRRDATPGSADFNTRSAPHDSTAAEMLRGANGHEFDGWAYVSSPHADPERFRTTGEPRWCLSCHSDVARSGALGGHTFRMRQGTGDVVASGSGGDTVGGTGIFRATTDGFLRRVFPGDVLSVNGADHVVVAVDTSRQLRVEGTFAGGATGAWSVTSTPKFNTAACTQCHTVAPDFRVVARGDYDGDGATEVVQDEVEGLLAALKEAVDARLTSLLGAPAEYIVSGGRIRYRTAAATRVFPGPSVSATDNPDVRWDLLAPDARAAWEALYRAAYNHFFVTRDLSGGIHNTGYAVNLLQSSLHAVTGSARGVPFVPF